MIASIVMISPSQFYWFEQLSLKLKIACVAGLAWLAFAAWPVAVAAVFAAIVLTSLRDKKAALALVAVMAVPALAMEGVWASMLVSGLFDRQEQVAQTYSVTPTPTPQQQPIAAVRGAQDAQPDPTVRVVSAISGDLLKVTIGGEPDTLRLIGIVAPEVNVNNEVESECFGLESYMFLNSLLSNQTVDVEKDAALGDRDVDESLLRYVSLKDGTSVNELMLEAGLAQSEKNLGYRYQDAYMELAIEAEAENKGLWASCNADGTPKVSPKSEVESPTPTVAPTLSNRQTSPGSSTE